MDFIEIGYLILLLICSSLFAIIALILITAIIEFTGDRVKLRFEEFAGLSWISKYIFYILRCRKNVEFMWKIAVFNSTSDVELEVGGLHI